MPARKPGDLNERPAYDRKVGFTVTTSTFEALRRRAAFETEVERAEKGRRARKVKPGTIVRRAIELYLGLYPPPEET